MILYPQEIWKSYKDTRYDVSTFGRVRSTTRPDALGHIRKSQARVMVQKVTQRGYNQVQISGNWKMVHRLVMETFIGPSDNPNRTVVDHINNNKTDNFIGNLQWLTIAENTQKAYKDGRIPPQTEAHKAKNRKRLLQINESHKKPVEVLVVKTNDKIAFPSAKEASVYFKHHVGYFGEMLSIKKCHGHFGQNRATNPDYKVKWLSEEEYKMYEGKII